MKLLVVTLVGVLGACGKPSADSSQTEGFGAVELSAQPYKSQTTSAWVNPAASADASGKRTALVYYAVDTEEPFMQAAVDYEVRSLRATCTKPDKNINWVAFLNSYYIGNDRNVLVCHEGSLSTEKFDQSIDSIIKIVSNPAFDSANPEAKGLTVPLHHPAVMSPLFSKYPLSHPDVLETILKSVVNRDFPAAEFTLTVHFKSHGSNELLLAGLTGDQLTAKVSRQKSVFKDFMKKEAAAAAANTKASTTDRSRVACEANGALWNGTTCHCGQTGADMDAFTGTCERRYGEAGRGMANLNELGLNQTGLGRSAVGSAILKDAATAATAAADGILGDTNLGDTNLGDTNLGDTNLGDTNLGDTNLGDTNLGDTNLGDTNLGAEGLGTYGLGASAHFGTPHPAMAQVLDSVVNATGTSFSFIAFESCESEVEKNTTLKASLEGSADHVQGFYSATGALWYRNFDWNYILPLAAKSAGSPAQSMTKILEAWSAKIVTFVP